MWKRRGTKEDYIKTNQVEPNICCKNLIFFILKYSLMKIKAIKAISYHIHDLLKGQSKF